MEWSILEVKGHKITGNYHEINIFRRIIKGEERVRYSLHPDHFDPRDENEPESTDALSSYIHWKPHNEEGSFLDDLFGGEIP